MKISEFKRLLTDAISEKVRVNGTAASVTALRDAFRISRQLDDSADFWPSIAAYRASHACMRCAETITDLEEVLEMLGVAAETDIAEIFINARLLKIVVLTRIELQTGMRRTDEKYKLIDEAQERLRRMTQTETRSRGGWFARDFQSEAFNLLEYCAYLSGYHYEDLEGQAVESELLGKTRGQNYRILSNFQEQDNLNYPPDIADLELARMMRSVGNANVIIFRGDRDPFEVCRNNLVKAIAADDMRIWASLLTHAGGRNLTQISYHFRGNNLEALKKRVERTRRDLRDIFGTELITSKRGVSHYSITKEARVVGVFPAEFVD